MSLSWLSLSESVGSGGHGFEHMNEKEKSIFTMMWSLLLKHHQLLGDTLPIANEIASAFEGGSTPSPEQLLAWKERYDEMNRTFCELTGDFAALQKVSDPLFRFDS